MLPSYFVNNDTRVQPITHIPNAFESALDNHTHIYVIVSPPRCCSTAFSRVFWEQPSVGYYSHEPFEIVYYQQQSLTEVITKLDSSLKLKNLKRYQDNTLGDSLVIKEMPYQVGRYFPLLSAIATKPIMFLIRDPRLNIASRIAKKQMVNDSPLFPLIETGWELLASQIAYCQRYHIPYLIIDATDFRNQPKQVFSQLFARFQLPFSESMLNWRACHHVDLDNLSGQHRHLYKRVLTSKRLEPAAEPIPSIDSFPQANGFRQHVDECLQLYKMLRKDTARIRVREQ